jgi:hypothetical protein
MMHVVYYTDTGAPFSIGSVLADPMPAEFSVYGCTDVEAEGLADGSMMWDAESRTLVGIGWAYDGTFTPPAPEILEEEEFFPESENS